MARGYVYMMTNRSRTLYVGVTNDLARRVTEHKAGTGKAFTARYRIDRLVWFEETDDMRTAIEGEKRIKGWTRARKTALVEALNPNWEDLSVGWISDSTSSANRQRNRPGSRVTNP
ncbi:MAG TPA: GIY-YIG nuclease family protein [bacterium]